MAYGNRWTRRLGGAALTLAALAVAACSAGGAGSAGGAALPVASGGTGGAAASPAAASGAEVTRAEAQRVFDAYVAVMAKANRTGDGTLALSVVTGVRRAAVATAIKENRYFSGKPSSGPGGSGSGLRMALPFDENVYGKPTFYLPEQGGYPHWFVASAPGTSARAAGVRGTAGVDPYQPWSAGPGPRPNGTALLLFEQSAAGAPWKLASSSVLASGAPVPALATDSAGYIPAVKLSDASLLARPDVAGPLQAAVVDDGPGSAASRAVAAGALTTGMYDAARGYAAGLRPPPGDLYQWHLEGSNLAKFAFRTAGGGALVFYAMYLNTVIAVPAYLNKGYPVNPGPVIGYTPDLSPWLSATPSPRISLERQDLLSFVAIDPPAAASGGTAKVRVIACGGTLNYATAS